MKLTPAIFLLACSFLLGPGCFSQPADYKQRVSLVVDSVFTKSGPPGILVAISKKGERTYFHQGYADPSIKLPFDSASFFEAGSITKTFTAWILESVLAEKNIPETDKIIRYLPDSIRLNPSLRQISFLDLLNHGSGLPRLPDNMNLQTLQPYQTYTPAMLYRYLTYAQPAQPGISRYSNLGYGLAGLLSERIAGRTFDSLVLERILLPLEMDIYSDSAHNRSRGFFDGQPMEYWSFDALKGAGYLKLNARGLLNYLEYFLREPSGIPMLLVTPTLRISHNIQVARGWHLMQTAGKPPIIWHNGGTYGFSTFAAFDAKNKSAVVVVVNSSNFNSVADALGFRIMKMLAE